jgi:hypothetical protein
MSFEIVDPTLVLAHVGHLGMAAQTCMFSADFEMDTHVLLNVGTLSSIHPLAVARFQKVPGTDTLENTAAMTNLSALRGLVCMQLDHEYFGIQDVLAMTRWSRATDPRDRIFALVGLCVDIHPTSLTTAETDERSSMILQLGHFSRVQIQSRSFAGLRTKPLL